jgi:hypothetical protein
MAQRIPPCLHTDRRNTRSLSSGRAKRRPGGYCALRAEPGRTRPLRPSPVGALGRLRNSAAPGLHLLATEPPNFSLEDQLPSFPICRSRWFEMSRTMWLALFCMVGLGPAIAIKVAALPAAVVVEPAPDQSRIEPAFAPNELAKADRLELPDTPAKTELVVPVAKPMPAESPSTSAETIEKVDADHAVVPQAPVLKSGPGRPAERNWRNANARISPVESPRRRTKSNESMQSTGKDPPNKTAEAWHCRQDAMGSLLRSLDLSPRCNL